MNAVTHRFAVKDDLPFIYATMLKSLWSGKYRRTGIESRRFYSTQQDILGRILSTPNTHVLVACPQDDAAVILGYIVLDPARAVLHYIYVKGAFQNCGIAKDLILSNIKEPWLWGITHLTDDGAELWQKVSLMAYADREDQRKILPQLASVK